MKGPRIGRPDRLALYDAPAPTTAPADVDARPASAASTSSRDRWGRPAFNTPRSDATNAHTRPSQRNTLLPRPDRLARFLEAADVVDQLERLPAALGELTKRLARIVYRSRVGRHDDAVDAVALLALEDVRARAWNLYVALGRARGEPGVVGVQTNANAGGGR